LRAQANQHPLDVDLAQFDIAATAIEQLQQERDALAAHVERLVKVCELARDNHEKMLLTDPPQYAWKYNQVTAKIVSAIASTPQQSLAERDAEMKIKGAKCYAGYLSSEKGVFVSISDDDEFCTKLREQRK